MLSSARTGGSLALTPVLESGSGFKTSTLLVNKQDLFSVVWVQLSHFMCSKLARPLPVCSHVMLTQITFVLSVSVPTTYIFTIYNVQLPLIKDLIKDIAIENANVIDSYIQHCFGIYLPIPLCQQSQIRGIWRGTYIRTILVCAVGWGVCVRV